MCQSTVAIYSFLDDLLKSIGRSEDKRRKVPDAQVVTTAVIAMLYFGGNYAKSSKCLRETGLFSRSLSRSRFSRRLARLSDLMNALFHQLGSVLKDLNYESRYMLDSFPVPICDNIRISRCRLARGECFRGYQASKRRYFYGVRVQVVATVDEIPVEFCVLPAAFADINGLAHLPLDLPEDAEVAADAAYTNYDWEDDLLEEDKIKLLVSRKSNSKRADPQPAADYKFWLRHRIETMFGEIAKLFPKKIHATTLKGFLLKIQLFLFAFQLDKAFVQ